MLLLGLFRVHTIHNVLAVRGRLAIEVNPALVVRDECVRELVRLDLELIVDIDALGQVVEDELVGAIVVRVNDQRVLT